MVDPEASDSGRSAAAAGAEVESRLVAGLVFESAKTLLISPSLCSGLINLSPFFGFISAAKPENNPFSCLAGLAGELGSGDLEWYPESFDARDIWLPTLNRELSAGTKGLSPPLIVVLKYR